MDNILQIVRQEAVEKKYSKKHIDAAIRNYILSDEILGKKIIQGVKLVNAYMSKTYYPTKNLRILQLQAMDIEQLVIDIYVGVAYCVYPELFTSVSAKIAGRLNYNDKPDAIKTTAELLAVLCETDVFDIEKPSKYASLHVVSRLGLPQELIVYIENTEYLPPMLCEPLEITDNYSNGYLTFNDSMILGKGNHHSGNLCLDVINKMNKVCLKLDTAFLSSVEEEPTFALDTQEKLDQWLVFKKQSYSFYLLLAQQANEFYLTHKVDKRGRVYAQGYHCNTQGTAFKKACIELANEELVEGVE